MIPTGKRIAFALLASVAALLSFPGMYYPGNQYGLQSAYYQGQWGQVGVYGAYSYFPNWNGYPPYGYRPYGSIYTPWDIRYGNAGMYGGYGYGYGGYVTY